MALSVEAFAFQAGILALAHDPLHVFLRQFQIVEEQALELAAIFRIDRGFLHSLQRQGDVAAQDLLPKTVRAAKEAVGQLLDFAHAQFVPAEGLDN
jgi:hypothetical protein